MASLGQGGFGTCAYNDLQDALSEAVPALLGEVDVVHILIAATESPYVPWGPAWDPREGSFNITNRVELYGGFDPSEGCQPAQVPDRDFRLYPTVLSGDRGDVNNVADNNYTVVQILGEGLSFRPRVDGLIIEKGYGIQTQTPPFAGPHSLGGGLLSQGSPVIANCFIWANTAGQSGGGMFAETVGAGTSHLTIIDTVFYANAAWEEGGALFTSVEATIVNSLFVDNHALGRPIFPNLPDSRIDGRGAAIFKAAGEMTLTNCTIADNFADPACSACNEKDGDPCECQGEPDGTLCDQLCGLGGGIYNNGGGELTIVSSILWDNEDRMGGAATAQVHGEATISYSDVEGGWMGTDNLNVDPQFVDEYRLAAASPCIDQGSPDYTLIPQDVFDVDDDGATTNQKVPDLDHHRRVQPCRVDMGAYEHGSCPWDTTGETGGGPDGGVGFGDLTALLLNWGLCVDDCCPWNTTGAGGAPDEGVAFADLTDLLIHWGACPGTSQAQGGGGSGWAGPSGGQAGAESGTPSSEYYVALEIFGSDGTFTEGEIAVLIALLEASGF